MEIKHKDGTFQVNLIDYGTKDCQDVDKVFIIDGFRYKFPIHRPSDKLDFNKELEDLLSEAPTSKMNFRIDTLIHRFVVKELLDTNIHQENVEQSKELNINVVSIIDRFNSL
tara:strand:- start:304 stop:639 length:336 start_codon:yes stop_codon:yes gene_type:complete